MPEVITSSIANLLVYFKYSMHILITESSEYSEKALACYRTLGTLTCLRDASRETMLTEAASADIVIGRLAYNFDKEFFDTATQLKILGTPTTGLDHIDVITAQEKNVKIISLKGERDFLMSIAATPEHTLALMLALLRNIPAAHNHVTGGGWDRNLFKGREIKGQTVGFYGFGRVATLTSHYVQAMGATVIAYDPYVANTVTREELFTRSTIIAITCALSDETKNSIGEKECSLMNDGVFFINTARGQIVDEVALLANLESGKIAGAALDVLADERILDKEHPNPLVIYAQTHTNLIITPHIAGATHDSMHATEEFIAKKIYDERK